MPQPPVNPTNAVGGSFILNLQEDEASFRLVIPPTQLVDRSYSTYWPNRLTSPVTALVGFGKREGTPALVG
jgi:hypothetical protein